MAKSRELDTIADRVPFEIKHRVHWLDFNPPAALFECISDQTRVIPVPYDELVAVFDVGIFKWYLADSALKHIRILSAEVSLIGVSGLDGLLVLLELHGI